MGSQQNTLNLQRAGAVAGFFPPGVPNERRAELDPPINPHKAADNVVPTTADTQTGLTPEQYREAFGDGRRAGAPDEEASLARAVAPAAAVVTGAGDDDAKVPAGAATKAAKARKAAKKRR